MAGEAVGRDGERPRRSAMSAVRGPYRPFRGSPVQVVVQLRGEVVVHEEQVAHLLGVGLPVCSQLSLAALSSGRATATQGPLGMGSVIAAGYMALKSKYEIQLTG